MSEPSLIEVWLNDWTVSTNDNKNIDVSVYRKTVMPAVPSPGDWIALGNGDNAQVKTVQWCEREPAEWVAIVHTVPEAQATQHII